MKDYLERIQAGAGLTQSESAGLFRRIVSGELGQIETAALLTALKMRGESAEEIAGAAQALLESALPFPRPDFACADTCGTGGDFAGTINVSTAAAFVAAEMGIPVIKHGNRSISSGCGSADVLEALGVGIKSDPERSRHALDEAGVCFLFAPIYHPGMRNAMPVRQALRTRTIFNIVGPLANPGRPAAQIVGVYSPSLCMTVARALQMLGCERALAVHGAGLDEIALHGRTRCAVLAGGAISEVEISPEEAGVGRFPLKALRGGDAMQNARAVQALLAGRGEPAHEAAVAINAGALAWVFGKSPDLRSGAAAAMEAIRGGGCRARLSRLSEVSNGS